MVLVLQADRKMQARCRRTLAAWGFEVRCTASAERVLSLVAEGPCDALVIDLDIPTVDGLGVLGAVRSHAPTRAIPIVVLSVATDGATQELVDGRGSSRMLAGAFDADWLAAELESVLSRVPSRAA
jgi:DNA-binding response OmpR family regulator